MMMQKGKEVPYIEGERWKEREKWEKDEKRRRSEPPHQTDVVDYICIVTQHSPPYKYVQPIKFVISTCPVNKHVTRRV